jgi:hypothetical protein
MCMHAYPNCINFLTFLEVNNTVHFVANSITLFLSLQKLVAALMLFKLNFPTKLVCDI